MLPPLRCRKIILYSPFLHEQYSMAIHTELLKTAISSSLYFSTLVINIVFSCLSLCRGHQHLPRPSTHNLILAVSLPLLCLAVFLPLILLYVRCLFFWRSQPPTSNDASVIFTPHTAPPSPIPSSRQRHRFCNNHQQHQHQLRQNFVCPFTRTQTEQLHMLYQILNIKLYFT